MKKNIETTNQNASSPNGWIDLIFDGETGGHGKVFTKEESKAFIEIKNAAKDFARAVAKYTPQGPGQTTSVRLIREALLNTSYVVSLEGNA